MMRWLWRLGFVGVVVIAAMWVWSKMNEDLDEEEFDEEIPIEFEVPLEEELTAAPSAEAGDTGAGPGADYEAAVGDSEPVAEAKDSVEQADESDATEDAAVGDEATAAEADDSVEQASEGSTDDAAVGAAENGGDDGAVGTTEANAEPRREGSSDLEDIIGIGPVFAGRLIEAGINSIAELADVPAARVQEVGFTEAQAENWIQQAREMSAATAHAG